MTVESFGQLLRRLRIAAGFSQNELSRLAKIDPAYVNRLERSGQKTIGGVEIICPPPSRPVVLSLAAEMGLSDGDTDRFLFAAGRAPIRDYQALYEEATRRLDAVRDALSDEQPTFIGRATG